MTEPIYRNLTLPGDPALASVKQIYEQSFPASERKPTDCFDQMLNRDDYVILIAETGGVAMGFAVIFIPPSKRDAALLEYLAVKEEKRGTGIGTALVQRAIAAAAPRPILAEVESADDIPATRRRDFYHRNGFHVITGLNYILPLKNAPPMALMMNSTKPNLLNRVLARWLTLIYQSVYSKRSNDVRLAEMIDVWRYT